MTKKKPSSIFSIVISLICLTNIGLLPISVESSRYDRRENTANPLFVTDIDYLWEKNGVEHRTSRFDLMENHRGLVVRRGQEFIVDFRLSREYSSKLDRFSIDFFSLTETQSEKINKPWKFKTSTKQGTTIRVIATPSVKAVIGKWVIQLNLINRSTKTSHAHSTNPIYVLFNPWSKDDAVYLPSEHERNEYVLNDYGFVFQANSVGPKLAYPWKFGQYERDVLDCALQVLTEVSGLSRESQNDPVLVSRFLTSALNVNYGQGLLEGSWSQNYSSGINPSQWTGSAGIFQEYFRTRTPVKYGQCWVFAGIYTTASRALGIPCRVVTGFNAIADGNEDLHVNTIVDERDKVIGGEITWNYHVWNEVWMKRRDLRSKFSGWQAVDATPMLLSDGYYRSGPAPLLAVRTADFKRDYDVKHVFSLVNARQIKSVQNTLTNEVISSNIGRDRVAGDVYTYVQSWEKINLTSNYVYEGRWKFSDDLQPTTYSKDAFDIEESDQEIKNMTFDLSFTESTIGSPLSIKLTVQNEDVTSRNISVKLEVDVVGVAVSLESLMSNLSEVIEVEAKSLATILVNYTWDDYGSNIIDRTANFKIKLVATEKSSESSYFEQRYHSLITPAVEIKFENKAVAEEVLKGTATFKNPLPVAMSNGSFFIEGPGLDKQTEFVLPNKIPVGGEAVFPFFMTPKHSGTAYVIIKFFAKELIADGHRSINITSQTRNS